MPQNLPCHQCAGAMERLLLTISGANGLNSELFKDVIGVLEQALSMVRASRSIVAPTSRCQFCPLAPKITLCNGSIPVGLESIPRPSRTHTSDLGPLGPRDSASDTFRTE